MILGKDQPGQVREFLVVVLVDADEVDIGMLAGTGRRRLGHFGTDGDDQVTARFDEAVDQGHVVIHFPRSSVCSGGATSVRHDRSRDLQILPLEGHPGLVV